MNYRGYSDMSKLIRKNISFLQSKNFDLIVGIPRSGMIPANMIAHHLNKDCCDITTFHNNYNLESEHILNSSNYSEFSYDAKNVLIVDDCIASGKSLSKSLQQLSKSRDYNLTTLCIYSTKTEREDVDLVLEPLPGIGIFEWNIYHQKIVEVSCITIDGVLCSNPTEKDANDNDKYLDFILNAPPIFIPSGKVNILVTSRLEKYRRQTEAWLKKYNVEYDSLIMLEQPSNKFGHKEILVNHKVATYKKSGNELFFESNREQSIEIHIRTKMPVYCVETNEMFSKNKYISALYGSKAAKIYLLENFRDKITKLPKPIYYSLRSVYRMIS
ncbi:phosphoribosyltransferase family protein [Salipaludibacillus sp. HK11]|uniref:phosphoribosyltransferase family protein n=1 Tax=Salipaludibacillus sp. HK11 TaxID=3394320 RepID=UPI0039FC7FCA